MMFDKLSDYLDKKHDAAQEETRKWNEEVGPPDATYTIDNGSNFVEEYGVWKSTDEADGVYVGRKQKGGLYQIARQYFSRAQVEAMEKAMERRTR